MSIFNAVKVGLIAVVATKVAIGSYKFGKALANQDEKFKILEAHGHHRIEMAFMNDEQINALVESYV
jgi:hypothetical protein